MRALGDSADDLQSAQQAVQETNRAYEEAAGRVEDLQGQIDANQDRIDELKGELPGLQDRATDSLRMLYKMQQGSSSLIDLLLSADDFYDLVSTIQYLDVIQSRNSDAVGELVALTDELALTQADLSAQRDEAERERQRAEEALEEARDARDRLESRLAAQAAEEAAERQAAIEAAQAEAESESPTFTTESGTQAPVEVPDLPSADIVVPGSDREAFVAEWAPRIDAYLAGSPLSGQGAAFAGAAWEYGCDPRLSPAISMVESGQGRNCFLPYNAWGWGTSSWGSWEEAIDAHVAGLAAGYGGQLTYATAQKYCPPNADAWYASVLSNMERI